MLLSADRGIKKGPHLARINERVNHTHQRMAREHGDLSSDLNIHFSTVRSFSPFLLPRNGRRSAMLACQPNTVVNDRWERSGIRRRTGLGRG